MMIQESSVNLFKLNSKDSFIEFLFHEMMDEHQYIHFSILFEYDYAKLKYVSCDISQYIIYKD